MKNAIIVILLLAVIVLGYSALKTKTPVISSDTSSTREDSQLSQSKPPVSSSSQNSSEPTPSQSVQNNPSNIPTGQTTTYTNNKLNFQIQLPKGSSTPKVVVTNGTASVYSPGDHTINLPDLLSFSISQQQCGNGVVTKINNISFIKTVEQGLQGGMESGSYDATYCLVNNGLTYSITLSKAFNRVDPTVPRPNEAVTQQTFDEEMKLLNFQLITATSATTRQTQAVLGSISPASIKIGGSLTLNGTGFMSVPPVALQGADWQTKQHLLVYLLKQNDPFAVPIFIYLNPSSDSSVTVTIPSQTCTHTSSGVCDDYAVVTPGIYTVWAQVYGQDKTDSLQVTLTN